MGQQAHFKSIGEADARADAAPSGLRASKAHGDVVKEAISGPLQGLILLVMIGNLALGVWLIRTADLSALRPGAAQEASQAEVQPEPGRTIAGEGDQPSPPMDSSSSIATAMHQGQ